MISKSILLDEGETVQYTVSAPDYISQQGEYTMETQDHVEIIVLRSGVDEFIVTIVTDSNNRVVINGVERTTATFPGNTLVTYSVSRSGYTTVSDQFYLNSDRTIPVTLNPEYVVFSIDTSLDNDVIINGVSQRTASVPYNSTVTYTVSRDHYQPISDSVTVTQDTTVPVTLTPDQYTFAIETSSLNTVTINGQNVRSITVPYNTLIEWEVTRTGYNSASGSTNLVQNTTVPVTLVREYCTLTILTSLDNYTIMDGEFTTVVTGEAGDQISWKVSRPGYVTQEGTHTLVDEDTLNINLVADSGPNYLRFDMLEDGEINWKGWIGYGDPYTPKTIEYSKNGGAWTSITPTAPDYEATISVNLGDTVKFRGNNASYSQWGSADDIEGYTSFEGTETRFNVSGNVMSLINGSDFSNLTTLTATGALGYLFSNTYVENASQLQMPATTITPRCYYQTFYNSTVAMAPALPALNLQRRCYYGMFTNCESLYQSPDLPALTLPEECYRMMFYGCTHLMYVKCLATGTDTTGVYPDLNWATKNWLNSVNAGGIFVLNQAATGWQTGVDGIPQHWLTREEDTGYYTFSISADHSSSTGVDSSLDTATITINGVQRKYVTALEGSTISYSVVKSGFPTVSDTYTLNQNHNEDIQMIHYTLTINPTPSDAVVTMTYGGQTYTTNSAAVDPGTSIHWECTKSGYQSASGDEVMNADITRTPTLTQMHTVTIQPVPAAASDATVQITVGGQTYTQNYWTDVPGTTFSYTVTKNPYPSVTGTYTIGYTDETVQVPVQVDVTFSISTDANNSVEIDGVLQRSKQCAVGQTVNYHVYRRGFFPVYGSTVVHADTTLPITLTENTATTSDYFTIQATEYGTPYPTDDFSIVFGYAPSTGTRGTPRTIEYSKNDGAWTSITPATPTDSTPTYVSISVKRGDIIRFRGDNASYADQDLSGSWNNYSYFSGNIEHYATGNIMSLINSTNFANLTTLSAAYTFASLFYQDTYLSVATSLLLPATSLQNYSYRRMFAGATMLGGGPINLPATSVPLGAYAHMYDGDTSLNYGSNMSATSIGGYGCSYMYNQCPLRWRVCDLTNITSVGEYAMECMFKNADMNIQNLGTLSSTQLSSHCYDGMFSYNERLQNTMPFASNITSLGSACCANMYSHCIITPDQIRFPNCSVAASSCFMGMYSDNPAITNLNYVTIPTTTLSNSCFERLFANCVNLTTIPSGLLDNMTLAPSAFQEMFRGDTGLTSVPTNLLPYTSLATSVYSGMFRDCTSLQRGPDLPATTASISCYASLFYGCTSLNHIKCMLASPASYYTNNWVYDVQTTAGTFEKNPSATWSNGNNAVPWNWTIQDAS